MLLIDELKFSSDRIIRGAYCGIAQRICSMYERLYTKKKKVYVTQL